MSSDVVKMDYPAVEEMIQVFIQTEQGLQDNLLAVHKLADALDAGALLGDAGAEYAQGLRNRLGPAIGRLRDKFKELAEDVRSAEDALRAGETSAGSKF